MASPAINMGRVVRLGSNAAFTFQLPQSGLDPADISFQAYQLDSSATHPMVDSSVVETSIPGTYMLTVQAADMVEGGIYYAAVGYDTVAFRIPAWSYAPANEFDQVLADLADVDAKIDAAVATLESDLSAQTTTLQGNISAAVTTLEGDISAAQTSLHNDIVSGVSTLHTDVLNAKSAIQSDVAAAVVTIDGNIAAAVTTLEGDISAAVIAIDNHTDSVVNAARDVVTGAISTAQTSLHNDIGSGVVTLQGDITTAKNAIQSDIASAKTSLEASIDTAKAAVISEINANEVKIDTLTSNIADLSTLVSNETSQLDSAVAAVDSKAQDAKVAAESLVADFASAGAGPAGRLKSLLDSIATDATASKMAAQAVRDEVGQFAGPNFDTLADMLGSSGFESSNKSLYARLGELDSAVGALETEASASTRQSAVIGRFDDLDAAVDTLETEASAASRQTAVLGRFDSVDSALLEKYTLAQGATDQIALLARFAAVDSAVSAVKAVLDSSLVENAKIIPNVPSSILSPMAEQVLRFTCNVTGPVNGSTMAGALEDPDNQEIGVRLYMADGSTGSLVEMSSTNLFEDSSKSQNLPSCAGSLNGVPSTFKKMKRDGVGQYTAFVKLEAFKHGNMQFDFQIVDSDPTGSPQTYQAVRYTEIRRQVSFTSFGAF